MVLRLLLGLALVAMGTPFVCERHKFVTFNTGLTPRIATYATRRTDIPEAIAATGADVMCLQEVWSEDDMAAILEKAKGAYPHSFSPIHHDVDQLRKKRTIWQWLTPGPIQRLGTTACSLSQGARLGWCLLRSCRDQGQGTALLACLQRTCSSLLASLSPACRTCLFVSSSSVGAAMSRCVNLNSRYNGFNPSGLLLLSKQPISTAVARTYEPVETPQFLPRGYIDAEVDGVGRVVCTHLSARLGVYLETALPYSSYEEQQRAEIDHLNSAFLDERHVLMGDLNTGPRSDPRALTGEFTANYQTLQSIGYASPYDDMGGNCTYCEKSNPLLAGTGDNYILDHVMSRTFSDTSARRVLTTYQGRPLSDHYGVEVEGCF